MPRLTRPPAMPRRVEVAIELVGNRARAEILRALSRHDGLTVLDLVDIVDSSRTGTLAHLAALEREGLIAADVPSGQRRGRRVVWRANAKEVAAVGRAFSDYIAGN